MHKEVFGAHNIFLVFTLLYGWVAFNKIIMGLLDILQRHGSVGSVVRWAYKNYNRLLRENNDLQKRDILKYMFDIRYQTHPVMTKAVKMRFDAFKDEQEIETLMDLCAII